MATVKEIQDQLQDGKWKLLVFLAAVIMVMMVIMDGFVSIPAGHVGVIFDQGRGVLENEIGEGLHLKIPFWQDVTIMDGRTQEYTMSIAPGEGAIASDDSIESRSQDGQVIWVDATILLHIDKTQADNIKRDLGSEKEYYTKIIRPKSREVVRAVVARHNALDLVSDLRAEIVQEMADELKADFADHDIVLEEVVLRNVTYSAEFANAIEQKEVARQQIKTAQYQKEQAEELKAKKIIEAEADAESIRLKGEALRQTPEVIQLEFVNKLAPNVTWGILPDGITPLMNMSGF
jgi:regulator of protease activity HflC (stomatin/prohibitin superfamily)